VVNAVNPNKLATCFMRILSLKGSSTSPSKSVEALFYLYEFQNKKKPGIERALYV
jgi:hypothetical protein